MNPLAVTPISASPSRRRCIICLPEKMSKEKVWRCDGLGCLRARGGVGVGGCGSSRLFLRRVPPQSLFPSPRLVLSRGRFSFPFVRPSLLKRRRRRNLYMESFPLPLSSSSFVVLIYRSSLIVSPLSTPVRTLSYPCLPRFHPTPPGVNESVSLQSVRVVTVALVMFMRDWFGLMQIDDR